ncbi:MAG TPA: FAD:protein FMN transferase, partial [Polyangiaceae bacterium]|nr:FAD:protein FMN transferase [Polyangiaceae bacterium]
MHRTLLLVLLAGCPSHPQPEARQDLPTVASASASASVAAPVCPSSVTPADAMKVTSEDAAMGTHLSFAAYTNDHVDEAAIRHAFADAVTEIKRVEALMTTWHPSDITRVNDAAGTAAPVHVGRETYDIVAEAIHASEMSKGAFDITFESLHGLWKFDEDLDPHPPTKEAVAAKISLVDYHHVKLDPKEHTVMLDAPGVRIGLGGIAKGYAVDRATAVLDKACVTSFYVQAGGDLFTRGHKPNGDEWQAGIRDPRGGKDQFFALLGVSDHSFSTAGDYERSYVIDGKRYHHIIDPKT